MLTRDMFAVADLLVRFANGIKLVRNFAL